jgi:hypothetical protein
MYKKEELFKKAKEVIKKHKLLFVEDIIAYLPCSKPTFYQHFPVDSYEFNVLKKMLEENKISIKTNLRKRWAESDNPSLEICLYKLCATPEERMLLSSQFVEIKSDAETSVKGFEWHEVKQNLLENQPNDDKPTNTQAV